MRKLFLPFIIACLMGGVITAYSQNFKQLKSPVSILTEKSDSRFDDSYAIAMDSSGNTVIAGSFQGSIKFGSIELNGKGEKDMFIAKRSSDGDWVWAKSVGGSGDDNCMGIAIDSSNNVYITGYFTSQASFGGATLSATGGSDIFFAKLDSAGNWQWVKQAGGKMNDEGRALTVTPGGTVYATGGFKDTATFGTYTFNVGGIYVSKLDKDGNFIWTSQSQSEFNSWGNAIAITSNGYIYIGGSFDNLIRVYSTTINSYGSTDACFAELDPSGTWQWLKHFGSSGNDKGSSMILGGDGNFYLAGSFSGNATFGSKSATSNGNTDIYVAKLDTGGAVLKLTTTGGTGNDAAQGLSMNNNNNLLVCGSFEETVSFGATNLTASGQSDLFLASMDTDLAFGWALSSGGSSVDVAYGVIADNSSVYTTGSFQSTAIFANDSLTSLGLSDIFIAKANIAGTWNGAVKVSGKYTRSVVYGLAKDNAGFRYITGYFTGALAFGTDTLYSAGNSDVFVAKINTNGTWIWARSVGGASSEIATSLASDSMGNLYVAGYFSDSLQFGATKLTTNGSLDLFVAKLDSAGNWIWAKNAGGTMDDVAYGISVNANGKLAVTGFYSGTANFGSTTLVSAGDNDIFAALLDTAGVWQWAVSAGGTELDLGSAVCLDKSGNIFIGGYFNGSANFGSTSITGAGYQDMFVSKISSAGNWIWTKSAGDAFDDHCNSIAIDDKGGVYATGAYFGNVIFGMDTLHSALSTSIFVSKLDSAGNWKWTRSAGGSSDAEGSAVYTLGGNYVYIAGNFSSSATFGTTLLTSLSESDIFISMLDKNGNFVWAKSGGGESTYLAKAISGGVNGNVNVAGYYMGTFTCGALSVSGKSQFDRNPFIIQIGPSPIPSSWNPVTQNGKSSTIVIPGNSPIDVNGRNPMPGDAIGCFYDSLGTKVSAGYGIWNGDSLKITVWGDNTGTPAKDGFDSLEAYSYRIWDNTNNIEGAAGVSYISGPSKFYNDSISVLGSLRTPPFDTVTIPLAYGWKMISANVTPASLNLDTIWGSAKSHLVLMKNIRGKTYLPQFNLNSIGLWSNLEGYTVFMNTADTLKIIGEPIIPENTPLYLSYGWHIIPYLRNSPLNISTALAGLNPNLVLAKNSKGQNYIPAFNINTIGNMQIGDGYQIFLSGMDTLTYSANSAQKKMVDESGEESFKTEYFKPDYELTGNDMTLYLEAGRFPEGTEIAAFDTKGSILGAGKVIGDRTLINIWGNNSSTPDKDGAVNGELITLLAKYPGSNSLTKVVINNIKNLLNSESENDLAYLTDAFYKAEVMPGESQAKEFVISPNPTAERCNLQFHSDTNSDINVRVYDAAGRMLINIDSGSAIVGNNSIDLNTDRLTSGTYILRVTCGSQIFEQNLVVKK